MNLTFQLDIIIDLVSVGAMNCKIGCALLSAAREPESIFHQLYHMMSCHELDHFHCDPDNWKLGIFYFCRADQRMIVPKRIRGLGWTLNFARPLALPFLAFIIALVIGFLELSRCFGAGGDARFAIKLLLALAIIALCYRLSNPPKKNAHTESDSNNRNVS